jgi:hypothetical protein
LIIEDERGEKHVLDSWKRVVIKQFVHPFNNDRRSWDVYLEEKVNEPRFICRGKPNAPQFVRIAVHSTEEQAKGYVKGLPITTQEVEVRRMLY